MMTLFLRAVLVGLSIAAPVGPISVLCLRRSLDRGPLTGFISGVGAATADGIYGCLAAFGLSIVSRFLVEQQAWISLLGGLFLCALAVRSFIARPSHKSSGPRLSSWTGLPGAYASTLVLTLTNPMTILFFLGIFAGLGTGEGWQSGATGVTLVTGVFVGSLIWWFALSSAAGMLRRSLQSLPLRGINRASGVILGAFGIATLARLI